MFLLAVVKAGSSEIDTQTIAIISGTLIPILVGLVTRLDATAGLKAVMNLGLSAVSGALATVATNSGSLVWREFVTSMALTWVTSIAAYYGLLKPTGIAGSVAAATPYFGIGSPPSLETDDKGAEGND